MNRILTSVLVYISVLLLTACAAERIPFTYTMDIQQGTIIEQERVAQLKPGMTRRQVEFLMGSPAVEHAFRNDRWDYVYTLREDGRRVGFERVTVLFENDRVSEVRVAPETGRG